MQPIGFSEIVEGLNRLGLSSRSAVAVHASMRSFGPVAGGAQAVCEALTAVCGSVLVPAFTWSRTGVRCPPGLARPRNAYTPIDSWEMFDADLAAAVPFSPDLPVDPSLGVLPEVLRQTTPHSRGSHPLLSLLAVGRSADELVAAQRWDWPLGPFEVLEALDGDVLLLGVGHDTNTAIHLAEQRLGRSRFYRYAKAADGVWMELPNISGESHRFPDIEPALTGSTRETLIGSCRARAVSIRDLLAAVTRSIEADPAALLCDQEGCRCEAALQQRLTRTRRNIQP